MHVKEVRMFFFSFTKVNEDKYMITEIVTEQTKKMRPRPIHASNMRWTWKEQETLSFDVEISA